MTVLRSPYPWFGGKSAVAEVVWKRLGDVRNFVEPFFGSGAMTLARPHWPFDDSQNRIETINDKDGFVANFWRAMQSDPDGVYHWCNWPVNEADLHARHFWLVNSEECRTLLQTLKDDPEHYNVKVAGWWVWGICQWIGSGWCAHPEWQQRPHLGDAGMGIHRPSQKRPHLGDAGRGDDLHSYIHVLCDRMRRVRVCCGDWSRVCGPAPTVKQGLTGVFLDPPYNADAGRNENLYAVEDLSVSNEVREWCKEMGGDKRIRIVLAGYAGEGHEELESLGWDVVEWKARGGYGNQGDCEDTAGRENAKKERLWFSPHCIGTKKVRGLFD